MTIRHAKLEDIDEMLRIYRLAKEYMDKSGNPTQWKPGHPNRAVLEILQKATPMSAKRMDSFTQRLPLSWVMTLLIR